MKQIELTQGYFALVDDIDFDRVSKYTWTVSKHTDSHIYAVRGYNILMHRFILGLRKGQTVDHINHNGLDNRRTNLRICTNRENMFHKKMYRNNTTGYKGVKLNHRGKYQAVINKDNKRYLLGSYATPKEAAIAYNKAAVKYHGEYALLNEL